MQVKNNASKQTGDSAEVVRLKKIIEKLKAGQAADEDDDGGADGGGGGEGGGGS